MLPTTSHADTIKVGFGYSKPPFVFATSLKDPAKPHGIEIEIMREAFALRGHTVAVSYFLNTELQEQLRKGNIDVATTVPYGQDPSLYYSKDIIYFWNYAITQPEDPRSISSIDDLKGRKVTAWLGAKNDLGIGFQKILPKMELYRELENQEEQVLLFLQKKLDTIVIDWNIFSYWAHHHGYDPTKYHQHDIFGGRTWFSAAFTDQTLRDDFQQGFNQLKLNGTYDEIYGQLWTSFHKTALKQEQSINLTKEEEEWLQNNPTINIGTDSNYPPFEFVGSRGQFVGISADYLALINAKLGTDFKAQISLSWSEVLEKTKRGEIDAIATIANTEERRDHLNFTAPYIRFPMVILSRKDQEPVTSLIDLYGLRLAVVTDFFYVNDIQQDHPEIKLSFVDSPLAALRAVSEGDTDAAIVNFAVANHLMVKHGFGTLRTDKATEIESSEFGYAVRKELPELLSILDKALASISKEEHQYIRDRWIAHLSDSLATISNADLSEQELEAIKLSQSPVADPDIKIQSHDEDVVYLILACAAFVVISVLLSIYLLPRHLTNEQLAKFVSSKAFTNVIMFLTGIIMLIIFSLVWYTLEQSRQSIAKNVKEDLSFVLKGTSERLDLWINDRKQDLSELAEHPELVQLTQQILNSDSDDVVISSELERKVRHFIHSHGGKDDEKIFFIISPERMNIASSSDGNIGRRNLIDRFAQQRLDRVFKGNPEFIPPIDFGLESEGSEATQPSLHQFSMFFAAPIKDENGKILAVLAQRLKAGGRISQIMNQGRLGSSGESYLINTEGEMLTTSRFLDQLIDIGLLKKDTKDNELVQLKDPGGNLLAGHRITKDVSQLPYTYMADNLLKLSQNSSASSEFKFSKMGANMEGYRDYRGVSVLGVWQWSHEHGLGITTEIDKSEALESYYQLRLYLILIAVVSLLLILVSVILTLTIGQRATSFVRRSNEELEILVKERTLRLRSIIENAADGIIVISNRGVVQNFSPAAEEIFGYRSSEVEGQNIKMLMPDPVRSNHDGYLEHYLESGKKSVIGNKREVVGLRKNGECFMMDLAVSELYIGSEHLYTGIVRDITDRKQVEEELRQAKEEAESATQAKSDFLANMSHEIRTPMNAIIGMSYLALQTELDRKQRGYVQKVNRSAESLLGIINDILDFSKIEAGKMDMEKIDFRLEDVFDNLANLIGLRAEEKSLEVMFDIPADIPMALIGDPLRLGQVLINLGNNAIKFTAQGEVVFKVAIHEKSEKSVKLHFSIRDSGIGMTQEQQSKLFQSFSQADASTTRKFGGTGLGLIISKNLIEMMQGDIWVDSEEGVGSTFHFTATLDIQQGVISDRLCAKKELGLLKVLVVDDNLSAREILTNMLISFGFNVDQASGGEAALAMIKDADSVQPYDLVVMDWKMPSMDGIEATEAIQNSIEVSQKPTVIIITAYDREEARTLASGIDIKGFLTKPVTASSLFNTIMQARGVESSIDEGYDRHEEMTDLLDKLRGAKVLLVEDNELNQELALELLLRNGIVATLAENGEQALEAVEKDEFDGVLMDCQMPIMDGYEATRRIRLSPEFEGLPIIAMTANAMSGDRDKVLDAGMNDHISKPINVKNMFQTMAKWITPSEPQPIATKQTDDVAIADIPEIIGIDQDVGLAITQGNKGLYRKLLLKYLHGNQSFASEFKAAQQNSEQDTQIRLAHTLKGTSGNIGAVQIQEIAGQLEAACENGQQDLINELMESLTAELEPIMVSLSALNDLSESNVAAETVDPDRVDELLTQLRDLLEDDDTDAADVIDELEKLPPGTLDNVLLKKLSKSVDEYDFETALSVLSDLIKNLSQ